MEPSKPAAKNDVQSHCISVFLYICMYVYIYMCVCVFMYVYTYVYLCLYIYMIWYDMIWYYMIWYYMIWYDMIWYVCVRVWENNRVKMNIWYHTPMSFQRPCLGSWLLWCRLHELLGSLPARQCLDLQNALGIADGQLLGFWDDLRTHKWGISSAGTNASVLHVWIEILCIYVDTHIYIYIYIYVYMYIYIFR